MNSLNERSLKQLAGVHPDLARVIEQAAIDSDQDFVVTEGLRSLARQKELFLAKKSQTMNGRHLPSPVDGLSRAVDLAIWEDKDLDRVVDSGELTWAKFSQYRQLAEVVKAAAEKLGIPIVWGGDWPTLRDGPHFELSRKDYP